VSAAVRGRCSPGLEPVRDAFADLVDTGAETGAACCVLLADGRVVNLTGGWADAARTRPWRHDTLVHTFSVSKPFAALAALIALRAAGVGLDAPVAASWPAYAASGKAATTWHHLLTHRSGLPAFPAGLSTDDLLRTERLEGLLAEASPEADPGTQLAEHALTYGHLLSGGVGALLGGRSLGSVLAESFARPLGLDLYLGVPADALDRCAELECAPGWPVDVAGAPGTLRHRALSRPPGACEPALLNTDAWRATEFGAIGVHASAYGLARAYAEWGSPTGAVATVLGLDLWRRTLEAEVTGHDELLGRQASWTLVGQVDELGTGMGGIGGSAAYVAAGGRYAFAYVTRRLADHDRMDAVEQALLRCLE
jgi:CubicO group peptidase (beta-lactamase class C family)